MSSALLSGPIDFTDGSLFGNDAGEDENPHVLNSYFVEKDVFGDFLSRKNRLRIVRSRKGMGKSALLSKLAYELAQDPAEPIVIHVSGAGLVGIHPPPENHNPLLLQNYWKRVMCARINFAIGKRIGFAFSETAMALVESAEIAGFRERNIIGSLLQRIKSPKIAIQVESRDYGNHEELLKRAAGKLEGRDVWLLVDDIDATFVNSDEQQAFVSSFFSACREMVADVEGLSIRISVRSDVWTALRKNEALDKCEQYISEISWTATEMKAILTRKILAYLERKGTADGRWLASIQDDSDQIIAVIFDRMRWGGARVPAFHPIQLLSAGRPRWMAQLCRLAGIDAFRRNKSLIGNGEINAILPDYSRLRLSDIYKEHSHQFDDLERLIETFANGEPRYTTTDFMNLIKSEYVDAIGADQLPVIDGFPYRNPMQLCHILYKVGFIAGRAAREGAGGSEFIRYEHRPALLRDPRNPDDGMVWEVHPSYREALNIGQRRPGQR